MHIGRATVREAWLSIGIAAAWATPAAAADFNLFMEELRLDASSTNHEAVTVGDFNDDGRPDIAALGGSGVPDSGLFLFVANSGGQFPTFTTYGAAPVSVLEAGSIDTGDFNGDGLDDLVATVWDGFVIFHQNAAGTLDPPVHFVSPTDLRVATGDFNNDGRDDVVAIGWGSQSTDVNVYLQDASGLVALDATYVGIHNGWDDLEVGDVNGDGLDDVVVMSGQGGADFAVFTQTATGTMTGPVPYSNVAGGLSPNAIGIGDFDGDGRADVVVDEGFSSLLHLYMQNAAGTLNPDQAFDVPGLKAGAIESIDWEGDGKDEILILEEGGCLTVLALEGGVLTQLAAPCGFGQSSINPHGLDTADFDGDGLLDVVMAPNQSTGVQVFYGTSADVSVTLSGDPNPLPATGESIFTASVQNLGPRPATAVRVLASGPPDTGVYLFVSDTGTCFPGPGCVLDLIPVGETQTVSFIVRSSLPGDYLIEATAAQYEWDSDLGNNTVQTTLTVIPSADLSVNAALLSGGPSLRWYWVNINNRGPFEAPGAHVMFDLDDRAVVMRTARSSGGESRVAADCTRDAGRLRCELGTMASGSLSVIELDLAASADVSFSMRTEVASSIVDPYLANNVTDTVVDLVGTPIGDGGTSGVDAGTAGSDGGTGGGGGGPEERGCSCSASRGSPSVLVWAMLGILCWAKRRAMQRPSIRARARFVRPSF